MYTFIRTDKLRALLQLGLYRRIGVQSSLGGGWFVPRSA